MENGSWNPEAQWSVTKDAGDRVHKAVLYYMKRDDASYGEALMTVKKELPLLFSSYITGVRTTAKSYDQLSASEREMVLLQNDPDRVKFLAGNILNSAAMAMAGSSTGRLGPIGQASPERFRAALRSLYQQFPSLAEAASSGFISATDWELLSTLIPSVSSEVRAIHNVGPLNLRGRNFSSSQTVRKYDSRGNEYRAYVR